MNGPPPSILAPSGDCVAIGKLLVVVILNEVKNLMISAESIIEILRLLPQNDITAQSPDGKGKSRRDFALTVCNCRVNPFFP